MQSDSKNIHPIHHRTLNRSAKEKYLNQKAKTIWLTGLSGSGKSTIAIILEREMLKMNRLTYLLDGDNIRSGINNDLDFSEKGRQENIRRIAEVNKLLNEAGIITINAFISPTVSIRNMAKSIVGEENFVEIHVDTPLEVCEKRDVKGLYKKARNGEITNFTGISAPYEAPTTPDFTINTVNQTPEDSVKSILDQLFQLTQSING